MYSTEREVVCPTTGGDSASGCRASVPESMVPQSLNNTLRVSIDNTVCPFSAGVHSVCVYRKRKC